MIEYVFPHYAKKEKEIAKIDGISRLFAYPAKPHFDNNGRIVILDSGAFGLSVAKKKMNLNYMKELSEHYNQYYKNNVICIASDEFLNPSQSMRNIQIWTKNNLFSDITAVLQADKKHIINIDNLKMQIDFYLNFTNKICFSNNGLYGKHAKSLEKAFYYAKNKGVKWIHILGAGWSLEDIKDWEKVKYFDSMDSIMYYKNPNVYNANNELDAIKNILDLLKKLI